MNLLSYVYVEKLPYLKFGFEWMYFFDPLYHAWTVDYVMQDDHNTTNNKLYSITIATIKRRKMGNNEGSNKHFSHFQHI